MTLSFRARLYASIKIDQANFENQKVVKSSGISMSYAMSGTKKASCVTG